MSRRHIVDMHEIEAGIDKRWHAPTCRFDNDAPCRSRPDVARADRGRWVDYYRREPGGFHHVFDHSLGYDLAPLVGTDSLILGERAAFISRCPGAQFDRSNAARVDDPLYARTEGLLHDNASTLNVCSKNFSGNWCPEPVIGCRVDHIADIANSRCDRVAVANITRDDHISGGDVSSRT
jgi:hypothetical protein